MSDFLELRNFNVGTIRKGDESDLPTEASTFSLNIDPISEAGVLQGRKADTIITSTGPADSGTVIDPSIAPATSKGKFYGTINDNGTYHFVYYSNNVIKTALNVFRKEGSSAAEDSANTISIQTIKSGSYKNASGTIVAGVDNASLTNSSHIACMEEYNKALHIGMDDGDSKWVGIIKQPQFGHYQSYDTPDAGNSYAKFNVAAEAGTESGTFYPVIQDAKLKSPNLFTEFQWVVHSDNGYIYGAEWEGHYVHRFWFDKDNNSYTYLGKSLKRFKNIHGIAARFLRSGDSPATEGGVWVYDIGVGAYGTVYQYFVNAADSASSTHTIADVLVGGSGTDTDVSSWNMNRVGGICESYNSTAGNGYLYFSKWLKNESIIDEDDEDNYNNKSATGNYKQSNFLWKTSAAVSSYGSTASMTLYGATPQLSEDLKTSTASGYKGFQSIYIANPENTALAPGTGTGVGGNGMLQGGGTGSDFDGMTTGVNFAKTFGTNSHPSRFTDSGTNVGDVCPVWRGMNVDPWPSVPWRSYYQTDCGIPGFHILSEEEYRKDSVGLLFCWYENDDATAHAVGGLAVAGYNKGKGYFTDSNLENPGEKGKATNQLTAGNTNAATSHRSGHTDSMVDLRMTGIPYARVGTSTATDLDATYIHPLNNGANGINVINEHTTADEGRIGLYALDTYRKFAFIQYGSILKSYSYDANGTLTTVNSINIISEASFTGTDTNSHGFCRYSNGGMIDTKNRVIFAANGDRAQFGVCYYTETGTISHTKTVDFNNGSMPMAGSFTDTTNNCVVDVVLDPQNKEAYMMTVGNNNGFIININYSDASTTGIAGETTNWYAFTEGTAHSTVDNATLTNNVRTYANEDVHLWDASSCKEASDYEGTIGIDPTANRRILFWTGTDGKVIHSCTIGTGGNNNAPDYREVQTLDMGENGGALGFKVDPRNRTLYGFSSGKGLWTAKYNYKGVMKIISTIAEMQYGDTSIYGSNASGSSFNTIGNGWGETDKEDGSTTTADGGRALQVCLINDYHADNGQDDSQSTGAILFSALTLNSTSDTRSSFLIGATYNYLTDRIEVPKNALYPSDVSGYQPIILRTDGFAFDHSGHPNNTIEADTETHAADDGGCFGNTVGFDDNSRTVSTTWGIISVQDAATPDGTQLTIYDSDDIPFDGTKLRYYALRNTLTSNTDTGMKDRSKFVWATPYSAALVDDDYGTATSKQLVIACGNPGQNDVNSILAFTPPTTGNDIDNEANGGIVGIRYNESNIDLVKRLPSPRVVGYGQPYSGVGDNNGRINIFNGETSGEWYTLNINDGGTSIGTTFSDRILDVAKISLELDTEGAGYSISTVGDVFYKASFLYDGYQESPLGNATSIHLTEDSNITVTITMGNMVDLRKEFARVTHVKIYRATNNEHQASNPEPIGNYRFIKQLRLTGGEGFSQDTEFNNETWVAEFTDANKASYSYESATGISEVFIDTSLKYSISCQINNFHIVGKASSTLDPDISDNMIFKSRAYNYDQFNILTDRLMLPFTPTALATFQGRIWAFDKSRVCKIEPNQFYIEDTYPSSGCVDPKAIITTEYGMFFADDSNIYLHNGQKPTSISEPIDFGTYGWSNRDKSVTPVAVWDSNEKKAIFFFGVADTVTSNTEFQNTTNSTGNINCYGWAYSVTQKRWDLIMPSVFTTTNKSIVAGITSPYGNPYLFSDHSSFTMLKLGGHSTNRALWWWHSKDHDFGGRVLKKKLNSILIAGTESSGNLIDTLGVEESDDGAPYASPVEQIVFEVDSTLKEGTSLYSNRENTASRGKFKIKAPNNAGYTFKLKLNEMKSTKKINAIGLNYRIKGYR